MENKNDVERNRPAEAGRNSDNRLRDDSAVQPGVSTVTRSDTDVANERLTKTGGRDFITKDRDPDADATFDDDSAGVGDKE